ncbi:hypothetical protein ABTE19_21220, partial [Acinetobacter baumannii]
MKKILSAIILFSAVSAYAAVSSPQLIFPVACELGKTCYIQPNVSMLNKASADTKPNSAPSKKTDTNPTSTYTGTDIALS